MGVLDQALHYIAEKVIVRELVSDQIAKERFEECLKCPYRDAEENKCTRCGCFLDLKTKARVNWNPRQNRNEITHCPLGKWGDLETTNTYLKLDGKQLITV
jgi:hypothetical protein